MTYKVRASTLWSKRVARDFHYKSTEVQTFCESHVRASLVVHIMMRPHVTCKKHTRKEDAPDQDSASVDFSLHDQHNSHSTISREARFRIDSRLEFNVVVLPPKSPFCKGIMHSKLESCQRIILANTRQRQSSCPLCTYTIRADSSLRHTYYALRGT